MNYVIGRFYRVPTVEGFFCGYEDIFPVLGPQHEDAEIIGFKFQHYHLDYRFFNQRQWERLQNYLALKRPVLFHAPELGEVMSNVYAAYGESYIDKGLPKPILRRRKCQRPMPSIAPSLLQRVDWLPALYKKYADYRLGEDLICPHKGIPLKSLTPDAEGCVTCPGHQLRWHLATGKLRPHVEAK